MSLANLQLDRPSAATPRLRSLLLPFRWAAERINLPRPPLTALGTVTLGLGISAYVGAFLLGWTELAVVAAGCIVGLVLAAPFAIGRLRLDIERTVVPNQVTVGDVVVARLDIGNPRSRWLQPRLLTEKVDGHAKPLNLPAISKGATWTPKELVLPTDRRRLVTIGPAVVARRDPLHLVQREVAQTDVDLLWVHPQHRLVPPLPVGFAKDLEGPTSDTSPAGDVAFHALREYQEGDNFRHIHWMSSAKVGKPMVRHYVDNRRPVPAVVLDTAAEALTADQFEVAVEVAASIGVSALFHQLPVSVWSNGEPLLGRSRAGSRGDLLDRLTEVTQVPGASDLQTAALGVLSTEHETSAVILVTGNHNLGHLIRTVAAIRRHGAVIVVRVHPPGPCRTSAIPGARVLDVDRLARFAAAWTQMVHR